MYDWPEVSKFWDGFWTQIAERLSEKGMDAPMALDRSGDHCADWENPDLLLGQTCGWPYMTRLRGKVVPFARFDFGFDGKQGDYHSTIIGTNSRRDFHEIFADPQAKIAVNSFDSQSGFRSLSSLLQVSLEIPADRFLVTGSHRGSVQAVAGGAAQMAAIDAVSWRLAQHFEPAAGKVVVLGRTGDAPGLPLITSLNRNHLTSTLLLEIASSLPSQTPFGVVGITGIVAAKDADYTVLRDPAFGRLRVKGTH